MSTTIVVSHFAAAQAAAGVSRENVTASSVRELRDVLASRHGAHFASVFDGCSLLLDGLVCRDPNTTLWDIAEVHVLPPFAGG
jgi:molybdopterin converting factor small subunit